MASAIPPQGRSDFLSRGISGELCKISLATFIFRDLMLNGFWLALWFKRATPERQMAVFGEIVQLIAQGKIQLPIEATYPVKQIKSKPSPPPTKASVTARY